MSHILLHMVVAQWLAEPGSDVRRRISQRGNEERYRFSHGMLGLSAAERGKCFECSSNAMALS